MVKVVTKYSKWYGISLAAYWGVEIVVRLVKLNRYGVCADRALNYEIDGFDVSRLEK
jgi:hypothetical protein